MVYEENFSSNKRLFSTTLTAFVNLSMAALAFIRSSSFFFNWFLSLSLSDLRKCYNVNVEIAKNEKNQSNRRILTYLAASYNAL